MKELKVRENITLKDDTKADMEGRNQDFNN